MPEGCRLLMDLLMAACGASVGDPPGHGRREPGTIGQVVNIERSAWADTGWPRWDRRGDYGARLSGTSDRIAGKGSP